MVEIVCVATTHLSTRETRIESKAQLFREDVRFPKAEICKEI